MLQRSLTNLNSDAESFFPGIGRSHGCTVPEGWVLTAGRWILPAGWQPALDVAGQFTKVFELADGVARHGACSLPGVNIKYDNFMPCMWRAVERGYVKRVHAEFVGKGLTHGFDAGVQRDQLRGSRRFKNYPSADVEHRQKVAEATAERVSSGKTLDLGGWTEAMVSTMTDIFGDYFIFPLGAVLKALEWWKARPTDDHTRTGLNAATIMGILNHKVTSYEDVAAWLKMGHVMHVSDVDAAFPQLPFAPWLWPFMFHRFYAVGGDSLRLFMHLNCDFGTRGLPGTFKIFFVDVLMGMARSELYLTLPMAVHVDDVGMVGCFAKSTSREMTALQVWTKEVLGIAFKAMKDRWAAHVQYMIGFWWDSFSGTRTLDEAKLLVYMNNLLEFSSRRVLSLHERQVMAGRMQRAVMTMAPGASCLLANTYLLMSHLKFGWAKRRTTKAERDDYRFFFDVLDMNMGTGYYRFDSFKEAPEIRSDASGGRTAGGGFVSRCGMFDHWTYGAKASKRPIDFLEGDTTVEAITRMGNAWRGCWVPFGVDNQAFQGAANRAYSKAARLNMLLKEIFVLQIQFNCLIRYFWLGTKENFLADHLSRNREWAFMSLVYVSMFWDEGVVPAPFPDRGRVRTLERQHVRIHRSSVEGFAAPRRDMMAYAVQVAAAVIIAAAVRGWLSRLRRATASTTIRLDVCEECDDQELRQCQCGRGPCDNVPDPGWSFCDFCGPCPNPTAANHGCECHPECPGPFCGEEYWGGLEDKSARRVRVRAAPLVATLPGGGDTRFLDARHVRHQYDECGQRFSAHYPRGFYFLRSHRLVHGAALRVGAACGRDPGWATGGVIAAHHPRSPRTLGRCP